LCNSGARWFTEGRKPLSLREDAIQFFMKFVNADCERIAIENPVGVMSSRYRKPNQIIHPWQFGHPEQKATCLWLKNLPNLVETNNVKEYMMTLPEREREHEFGGSVAVTPKREARHSLVSPWQWQNSGVC